MRDSAWSHLLSAPFTCSWLSRSVNPRQKLEALTPQSSSPCRGALALPRVCDGSLLFTSVGATILLLAVTLSDHQPPVQVRIVIWVKYIATCEDLAQKRK